jgi:hypothetical protein
MPHFIAGMCACVTTGNARKSEEKTKIKLRRGSEVQLRNSRPLSGGIGRLVRALTRVIALIHENVIAAMQRDPHLQVQFAAQSLR